MLYSNWEGYGSIFFHDSPLTSGYYSLQAATGYWFTPGTFLQLRATTRLEERETTLSKIELYLFHRDLYFFPAPWGGVEGRVFLDRNRNGQFDPGEPGIPGVAVVLDGEEKTVTDNRGYFRLSRLKKANTSSPFPQGKVLAILRLRQNRLA